MVAVATEKKLVTIEEYLDIERRTGIKHEFYKGKIIPMAGGTIPHNIISINILFGLGLLLDTNPDYWIFGSDQKIYLPDYEVYVYADALVVSGKPIESDDETSAIVNPILIIEVLSGSTEKYDGGDKFIKYQSLESFKEYVLIRQGKPEVKSFFREENDLWRTKNFEGIENSVYFKSIDVTLPLSRIYKNISFDKK
jgi:Uma2 family endonuclease